MFKRIIQTFKVHQGPVFIFIIAIILFFRLIDIWQSGLPYLYYTDEWHIIEPVVDYLNQTLHLRQLNQTHFYLFYCPAYYYTFTYLAFIMHPILHLFGIVKEYSDYFTYYYNLIFIARAANLVFLTITFWFIYRSARLINLPLAGLITILQVSVSYPVLRMAGYAKAECFTMMLSTISFYFLLKFWKNKYLQKYYFYTLIFASIAVCAKLTAVTYAGPVFLLSTFLVLKNNPARVSLRIIGVGMFLALCAFVAFAPHSIFFAKGMLKEAFSMLGDSYFNSDILGGAKALTFHNILMIIRNFTDFFSYWHLLILSLFFSLFFIFKTDRFLTLLFWLIVITTCLLFRKVFLDRGYSYYTMAVYSVVTLCMWYFVLQTVRNGKTFFESKIAWIRHRIYGTLFSLFLGLLFTAYLIKYTLRDAQDFYKFPYSLDLAMYADRYDCLKSIEPQIPIGASILFDSRSPKPNPFIYNSRFEFDMRFNLENYRKYFSEYEYVFSGYGPSVNSAGFLMDAKINVAKGRLGLDYHEFFHTGAISKNKPTPYSKIANKWVEYYSKPEPVRQDLDWKPLLDESWMQNGLFKEWDVNHEKYPKNFECGGGVLRISRNDKNDDGIKLSGKNFIFLQDIKDFEKFRGHYVTLYVQMKTSVPNKFGIQIYDGKNKAISYHPGTGNYEVIGLPFKVDENADQLSIRVVNAQDIGSADDVVEVKGAILLPGNSISQKNSQLIFKQWQDESKSFWSSDISTKPISVMHWEIDWDNANLISDRIPNQYFTYIPLSKIPVLSTVRHLALVFPLYFNAAPEDEIIIEFQNISGVVLRKRYLNINKKLSENTLLVSEPVPFNETIIWNTNIANIKIMYRTKNPQNEILFPKIELY
jgi:hypothetical protein